MITAGQLLDFILEHRKDKVFRDYTPEEVAGAIIQGIEDNGLLYAIDAEGKLTGMILAYPFHKEKVLFIMENLAMTLSNLRMFAKKGQEMYPGYRLEYFKHDKHKKPDTVKLFNKLGVTI